MGHNQQKLHKHPLYCIIVNCLKSSSLCRSNGCKRVPSTIAISKVGVKSLIIHTSGVIAFCIKRSFFFITKLNKQLMNKQTTRKKNLEALREHRPPWPRQIITLILPTVKMLSLGCERLPTPLKKKKKKKKNGSGSLPAP